MSPPAPLYVRPVVGSKCGNKSFLLTALCVVSSRFVVLQPLRKQALRGKVVTCSGSPSHLPGLSQGSSEVTKAAKARPSTLAYLFLHHPGHLEKVFLRKDAPHSSQTACGPSFLTKTFPQALVRFKISWRHGPFSVLPLTGQGLYQGHTEIKLLAVRCYCLELTEEGIEIQRHGVTCLRSPG